MIAQGSANGDRARTGPSCAPLMIPDHDAPRRTPLAPENAVTRRPTRHRTLLALPHHQFHARVRMPWPAREARRQRGGRELQTHRSARQNQVMPEACAPKDPQNNRCSVASRCPIAGAARNQRAPVIRGHRRVIAIETHAVLDNATSGRKPRTSDTLIRNSRFRPCHHTPPKRPRWSVHGVRSRISPAPDHRARRASRLHR